MSFNWRSVVRVWLRRFFFAPYLLAVVALVALGSAILYRRSLTADGFYALCLAGSCFVCGYTSRMDPLWPRMHELRRTQYADVWDELASSTESAAAAATGFTLEQDLQRSGDEVVNRILRYVPLQSSWDVTEIGCGVARVGLQIAPLCHTWTGCDVSRKMLQRAAVRMRGVASARFLKLSGGGLAEVPSACADLIYCTNALPHFDPSERWRYVRDSFHVLREGGYLYIDTIALDSPEGWKMIENNLGQRSNNTAPPYMPIPSSPDELLTYFVHAGFSDVSTHQEGSFLITTGRKPRVDSARDLTLIAH